MYIDGTVGKVRCNDLFILMQLPRLTIVHPLCRAVQCSCHLCLDKTNSIIKKKIGPLGPRFTRTILMKFCLTDILAMRTMKERDYRGKEVCVPGVIHRANCSWNGVDSVGLALSFDAFDSRSPLLGRACEVNPRRELGENVIHVKLN